MNTPKTLAVESQDKPWWQSPLAWVVGLVVVALGVAVALNLNSGTDDASPSSEDRNTTATAGGSIVDVGETNPVEISGNALPSLSQPDTAIGQLAPVFSGLGFDGTPTEISADGTARLIGFFAHWCPHCQRELPRTVDWLESNDLPEGVEVVAISTAVDETATNFPPSSWFVREDWPATIIVDSSSGALTEAFGLTGYPFWVALNGDGTVAARVSGELDTAGFESLLATVAPGGAVTESAASAPEPTAAVGIRLVTANEGAQIQANPPADLVILDVRTSEEFDSGHIEGAVMIDFYSDDFVEQLAELDPDVPYLVYCRSGNRSSQTTPILASLGFTDVADIDGGILAWNDAGLPTVTD